MEGHLSRSACTFAVLMLASAACSLLPSPPSTVPLTTAPSSDPSDETLASELATFMDQQAANQSFSGATLVARRGHVLLEEGYRAADRRWKRPNTGHTQFRIASISKQFTAVAILLLQSRGKLAVRDRACSYLPECPPAWKDITLHQLLVHASGIPNYDDQPDYTSYYATPAAPSEVMAHFSHLPLDFAPGATYKYSNSGYIVLGIIIERVSGLPYDQFLRENIFTPLGMQNTGYLDGTNVAIGYANSSDLTPADQSDPTTDYAAGGLYSTVGDLYIWDQALFNDRFLSPDLRQMIFTAYEPMPELRGGALSYGYGSMVGEMFGHRVVGHIGRLEGYSSLNFYFPAEQVAVILLENQRNPPDSSIVAQLAAMVFEPAP